MCLAEPSFPCALPAQQSMQGSTNGLVISPNSPFLNVKQTPDMQAFTIGIITSDNTFDVLDEKDGWYQIKTLDGEIGWVHQSNVRVIKSAVKTAVSGKGNSPASERVQVKVKVPFTNIRTMPSSDAPAVGVIEFNEIITVQENKEGWYKISHNGTEGWITVRGVEVLEGQLVSEMSPEKPQPVAMVSEPSVSQGEKVKVISEFENIKSEPLVGAFTIGSLDKGVSVYVLDKTAGWIKISYNGLEGWINANNVVLDSPGIVMPVESRQTESPTRSYKPKKIGTRVRFVRLTLPYIIFKNWTVKRNGNSEKINQIVTPISVVVPLASRFDFFFVSSGAVSSYDNGDQKSLIGPTDGKLGLVYKFLDNISVNVGLNIPWGKNIYDDEERQVADVLAQPILGFGVKSYGHGVNLDVGMAYAHSLSRNVLLGIGAGYVYTGQYKFDKDINEQFDPGDEIAVTAGLDIKNDYMLLRTDVFYRTYGKDYLGSRYTFQQGDQIDCEGLFHYKFTSTLIELRAKNIIKGDNKIPPSDGSLVGKERNFIGNMTLLQSRLYWYVNKKVTVYGSLEFNHFGKSDFQWGNGNIFAFGTGAQGKLTKTLSLLGYGKYLVGDAKEANNNPIDLNGFELAAGLTLKL